MVAYRPETASVIKTLTKLGTSHALVLDKPLLQALGIDPDTPLQITVSGNSLIVTPARIGVGREAVAESIRKLRPRYAGMLKKLAE